MLSPWEAPKFNPFTFTDVPTGPESGLNPLSLIAGTGPVTVKVAPLLASPSTVTTTGPVVAPSGTRT